GADERWLAVLAEDGAAASDPLRLHEPELRLVAVAVVPDDRWCEEVHGGRPFLRAQEGHEAPAGSPPFPPTRSPADPPFRLPPRLRDRSMPPGLRGQARTRGCARWGWGVSRCGGRGGCTGRGPGR